MINNEFYNQLGERWYRANDDPVALLRAESRLRNPWVEQKIQESFGTLPVKILDIACGGGFLANSLAKCGYQVTGIDQSNESLSVARSYDITGRVDYRRMDAMRLEFAPETFHVVCAMDFLEHIDEPERFIAGLSRVLVPGGLFFFHTFSRNPLAWLVVIKGVEWVVKNTPEHMHVYELFIKPQELNGYCERVGMKVSEIRGVAPKIFSRAFRKLLTTGEVSEDFSFKFTRSKLLGYSGLATKMEFNSAAV